MSGSIYIEQKKNITATINFLFPRNTSYKFQNFTNAKDLSGILFKYSLQMQIHLQTFQILFLFIYSIILDFFESHIAENLKCNSMCVCRGPHGRLACISGKCVTL